MLLGMGHHTVPIPRAVWQRHVRVDVQVDFMTEDHRRIHHLVVMEIPRVGEPLSPEFIARELHLSLNDVVGMLEDLEKHMTFLFRNEQGAVAWAYPVTADDTPHRMTFSTGERVNAA